MVAGFVLLSNLFLYAIAFNKDTTSTESLSDDDSNSSSSIQRHGKYAKPRRWKVDVFSAVHPVGSSETIRKQSPVNVYQLLDKEHDSVKFLTYPIDAVPMRSHPPSLVDVGRHSPRTVRKFRLTTKQKKLLFTLLTMLSISIIGLVGVLIIHLMHKVSYDRINIFLVALAIGCLTGDALLHLLPHAFEAAMSKTHGDKAHLKVILSGLCAIAGMYLFLCCERAMTRRKTYKEKLLRKRTPTDAGRKTGHLELENVNERLVDPRCCKESNTQTSCSCKCGCTHGAACKDDVSLDTKETRRRPRITSTARLLVVGDAMHNFADGLAIGAAFAEHVSAGLCTAIAVVCHELPHEIGLFAVLLKTGMKARRAILANCFSSLMSIAGSMCGLYIGQSWNISPWIFALIAGIFLYLALVDMLPELAIHERSLRLGFLLENIGFSMGLAIMTVVAYYEKDIDSLLPHTN